MMTLENFQKLLDYCAKAFEAESTLLTEFGIDLSSITDNHYRLVELLMDHTFTKEGVDWIHWFLYEKGYIDGDLKEDMKAWDEHNQEICQDVPRLYRYLKQHKYIK